MVERHPQRCAIYTRKSSEEGLDQAFNSLDAQREACEAYIKSQAGEGWKPVRSRYDDGGLSGGTLERPALQRLLADILDCRVDTVVVYKVDRLTRSLADFARIVDVFDEHGVSFVSITQQFNTTTSMGRLTLNMLLSFAQFEREVTGERIRDKIAASKKKGMWMGGYVPLGYEAKDRTLVINEAEAQTVRTVFRLYLEHGNVRRVKEAADCLGLVTKVRHASGDRMRGGRPLSRGHIYKLLGNPLYAGKIAHGDLVYDGLHEAIIDPETWQAVRARLADNATNRRSGTGAAEPSLLAGLIHDDAGNRMSPSHAAKSGVRYRYYVSQAILQHRETAPGVVTRIPAREIEDLIQHRILTLLRDPIALIDNAPAPLSVNKQQRLLNAAKKLANGWKGSGATDRRAFLLAVVRKIVIGEDAIEIVLDTHALVQRLLGASERTSGEDISEPTRTDHQLSLQIAARLKRCGGEKRLVVPADQSGAVARPKEALVRAVARAHRWRKMLFADEGASIRAIAKSEGMTERYVARILRLAFLAPDIVEAILDGRQPAALDLAALGQDIPLDWDQQRRRFGFESVRS